MLQECLKDVVWQLQSSDKSVTTVVHGCYIDVLSGVTKTLHVCYRGVKGVWHIALKGYYSVCYMVGRLVL